MTDNEQLPAVRDDGQISLARLGTWLEAAESGRKDATSTGARAALRFYFMRELGLPAHAVSELNWINGGMHIGAQLYRALAERDGYRVVRRDCSEKSCTAALIRVETGEMIGEATFTIEQAKRAGLVRDGSAWTTYPERMLWARASTFVIQDYAPAVGLGLAPIGRPDDNEPEPPGEPDREPVAGVEDIAWPDEQDIHDGQAELLSDEPAAEN